MINTVCGTIIDVYENQVQVSVSRKAACQGCEAQGICHSLSTPDMDFRLPRPPMAVAPGDRVIIALEGVSLIKACTYAFFVPLCAIILALFLMSFLDMSTPVQATAAVIGFLASLVIVRKLGKRIDNPRIIEVIHEG